MPSRNIFDTRNVIRETPKMGNRFLLTPDSNQLEKIIFGAAGATSEGGRAASEAVKKSKLFRINELSGGSESVFRGKSGGLATDVLNLSLLSCTIPAFEFETGDVNRYNDNVKHITKFSQVNDMTTSFYDYINGSSTSIMLAWQSKVGFKLTGEIGYKSQYTCDLDLFVYGPNRPGYPATVNNADYADSAQNELLMQFKIFNAYPRSVDVGDFSYDNAEIKKVQVQFGYDMIVPYKTNGRSGTANANGVGFNQGLQVDPKNNVTDDSVTAADIQNTKNTIYDIFINTK
jgi:hypothetical protein